MSQAEKVIGIDPATCSAQADRAQRAAGD